jgi:hypothetical protein
LFDDRDSPLDGMVVPGASLTLRSTFAPTVAASDVTFGLLVYRSTDNLLVYDGHFTNTEIGLPAIVPGQNFDVDFQFRANLTRGHYRVVTRIYDNILQDFLAHVCPPATFAVEELRTWAGVAHMDVRPTARMATGEPADTLMERR